MNFKNNNNLPRKVRGYMLRNHGATVQDLCMVFGLRACPAGEGKVNLASRTGGTVTVKVAGKAIVRVFV